VQKKLRDSALCCIAWSLKKSFICDTHYTTWCEIQVENFLVDSTLCYIARSRLRAVLPSAEERGHLYLWFSLRIRNNMQKWFNPLITVGLIDEKNHQRSKISWVCPFKEHIWV
jgi:hypothetical protein